MMILEKYREGQMSPAHLHTGLGLAVTILLPLHRLLPGQLELVSQHLMMEIMCHDFE